MIFNNVNAMCEPDQWRATSWDQVESEQLPACQPREDRHVGLLFSRACWHYFCVVTVILVQVEIPL